MRSPHLVAVLTALVASGASAQATVALTDGRGAPGGQPPGQPPAVGSLRAEVERLEAELEAVSDEAERAASVLRARARVLYRSSRGPRTPELDLAGATRRHARIRHLGRLVARALERHETLDRRVAALRRERRRASARLEQAEAADAARREEEAAQAEAWARLFEVAPRSAPGPSLGLDMAGTHGFAARRGRLPVPVFGSATVQQAEQDGEPGVSIRAPEARRVRPVAPGRVAYADRHPGFGHLVVLDHGDGYYSLYARLARTLAIVGQSVDDGDTIGHTGAEPLFFQVRRGTRALQAVEWLGI
jgi:septal ring factor EnvC (AmiA/AmiB activator)